MTVVLLALAASVSWGVSDFLGGLTSRRLSLPTVLGITTPLGLLAIGILVAVRGEELPGYSFVLWGLLAGLLGAIGISALYQGLAVGQMGVVAPISASAPLIPITVGLIRGDRPSGLQGIGIGLAIVGVILTSRERVEGSRRGRVAQGAAFGLIAATGFGVSLLALDEAANADPYWATFIVRFGATVTVLAALLVIRPAIRAPRSFWPALLTVGVLDIAGTVFFSVATTKGLLSIVAALISMVPVVVALLARIVVNERLQQIQIAGAAMAVAGVVCISVG
jgi:drug/metabolite transporter (DMT)-like permease